METESIQSRAEPNASRPHMPGYGIQPADQGRGLLPWSWAVERLSASRNYWVATTRADGKPHVMPVWGVWVEDGFFFSTSDTSRKARNLEANPQCVICTEHADEAVIVEGSAEKTDDAELLRPVWDAYKVKYNWAVEGEAFYAVHPRVAFAFIERADQFAGAATRWTFG